MVFIPPDLLREKDPEKRKKNLRGALMGAVTALLLWGFALLVMLVLYNRP